MSTLPARLATFAYVGLLLIACSGKDPDPVSLAAGGGGGRAPAEGRGGAATELEAAAGASATDDGASATDDGSGASNGASGDAGGDDAGAASAGGEGNTGGVSGARAGLGGAGLGGAGLGGAGSGGAGSGGAGSGGGNSAGAAGNPNDGLMIPCAVNKAYSVCHTCHLSPPVNGAPFALLTLDQHQAYKSLEIADLSAGIMPLGSAISGADLRAILDWLLAGAQGVPQTVCPAASPASLSMAPMMPGAPP